MAQYNAIKASVNAYIKANGRKEITGNILNGVLNQAIDSLGRFYQYAGNATPDTDPGTPDQNVAFAAGTPGTYTHFDGIELAQGEFAMLKWDGEWTKQSILSVTDGISVNEEDLKVVTGVGIQFNDRLATLTNKGYKILRPDKTFAEQVVDADTAYEIRYGFDLGGESFSMPSGCTLHFVGGSVSNGNLTLNGCLLSGEPDIRCDIVPGSPCDNDEVNVDWFGTSGDGLSDDSKHLLNAVNAVKYNGATLAFGMGKTYLHGDGLPGDDGTGNSYTPQSGNPARPDTSLSANIGRDITLRFLGYDNLTIQGNGSSIVSNEKNGICKHNAVFFFGACNYLTIRDISIIANNKARYENSGVNISDYSTGNFGGYVGTIYENWRNHTWSDDDTKGFALRGNMYFYGCDSVIVEGVISRESEMDGFYASGVEGIPTRSLAFHNCTASFNLRLGMGFNVVSEVDIDGCDCSYNGKFKDLSVIGASSNNSGISTELETEPTNAFDHIKGVYIHHSKFVSNNNVGVRFSNGTRGCIVEQCSFDGCGFSFGVVSGLSTYPWRLAEDNVIRNCVFHNGGIGLNQSGSVAEYNAFSFDKNFTGTGAASYSGSGFTKPVQFIGNKFEADLTDIDVSFDCSVQLTGYLIIRDNYFKNLKRPSSSAVILAGLNVCDNTIEASDPNASTAIAVRANYALIADGKTSDLVSTGNKTIGFSPTSAILGEPFRVGANTIIRTLPFDSDAYTNERWYELPKCNGEIIVTTQRNFVYRIHIFYDSSAGRFRAVYYDGLATNYTLEAVVYYKTSTAYLKIKLTNNATIRYEQYMRSNQLYLTSDFSMPTISAPDVSTFTQMVNLCLTTDQGYTAIDALLSGVSIFKDGKPHWFNGSSWVDADGFGAGVLRSGATADRPNASSVGVGFTYFDTTEGKMIVSNGTTWVNMDGTPLA